MTDTPRDPKEIRLAIGQVHMDKHHKAEEINALDLKLAELTQELADAEKRPKSQEELLAELQARIPMKDLDDLEADDAVNDLVHEAQADSNSLFPVYAMYIGQVMILAHLHAHYPSDEPDEDDDAEHAHN